MPGTAKEYGLEVNSNVDERYHIEKSTRVACTYLKAKSVWVRGHWQQHPTTGGRMEQTDF